MAASLLPENRFNIRSISLPTRSHPFALKVEECLNKLKIWEASKSSTVSTPNAKTLHMGLAGLVELYTCVHDFFQVPLIQQALLQSQNEKLVEEALDESVYMLDICGTARNALMMIKGGIQDLQSALRRKSGGESSIENQISAYICMRKKMKKEIKKSFAALKRMNEKNLSPVLSQSEHLSLILRVLREVCLVTISIFQHILTFISSSPAQKKLAGWSLVSKLMNHGSVDCEKKLGNANEVQSLDVILHALCRQNSSSGTDFGRVRATQKMLQNLEICIGGLEDGLECMHRSLIQTRVSLLNVLNH